MRIFADTIIPIKNPNPPDPRYQSEFPREEKWQTTVSGWFKQIGLWSSYHTYKSTHSTAGFPDLFCLHTTLGRRIWAELKTETGTLTESQLGWLTLLAKSGEEVYLWRPSDSSEIQDILQEAHNDAFSLRERGFAPKR